ncbi:MAG: prepilin-type N-terminal cleavage/methylation domain-containing protein [Spirochaetes bacterium]|nr:prepilin-type N-terminal cleavage/methylation domain-containing protein [Spirochaetota bacterium]MBN2770650.1 prepilin-type N-terminal cleavage/methylation domain-containing protein [Spirochaetota bacterium]
MKKFIKRLKSNEGFTLLELLVAVTISSIVMMMIYGANRTIMFAIHDMSGIADFYENTNMAIRRMDRDLSCTLQDRYNKELFLVGENNPYPPYMGRINMVTVVKSEIYVAGSYSEPAFNSDIKEISYFLKPDPSYPDMFFLMRKESIEYNKDDENKPQGIDSILLENVIDMRIEYTEDKINDWSQNWDSRDRNRFPFGIRVTLTLRNYRGQDEIFTFTSLLNRYQ